MIAKCPEVRVDLELKTLRTYPYKNIPLLSHFRPGVDYSVPNPGLKKPPSLAQVLHFRYNLRRGSSRTVQPTTADAECLGTLLCFCIRNPQALRRCAMGGGGHTGDLVSPARRCLTTRLRLIFLIRGLIESN